MPELAIVVASVSLIVGAYLMGRSDAYTKVRNLCGEILTETDIPFPNLWDIDKTVNKQAYTQGRLDVLSELFGSLPRY